MAVAMQSGDQAQARMRSLMTSRQLALLSAITTIGIAVWALVPVAGAAPLAAAASQNGIDCGCPLTGPYVAPNAGRNPEVRPDGTSPTGKYQLTTSTLGTQITVTIRLAPSRR
jgi:hypothetical protein